MDRVSSNIIKNDFKKVKEKQMKKPAKKKERFEVVCDLVDCWIDDEITKDELVEKLMKIAGRPIIKVGCFEYIVEEWKDNMYLSCRPIEKDGSKGCWGQVEHLGDWTIWEYNQLVDELHKHYPEYPIEYLEGRFV